MTLEVGDDCICRLFIVLTITKPNGINQEKCVATLVNVVVSVKFQSQLRERNTCHPLLSRHSPQTLLFSVIKHVIKPLVDCA